MKKCPFCAEEIQDDAIKCRFCNEFLAPVPVQKKIPWYFQTNTIWTIFICFAPLSLPVVLPMVCCNPNYSRQRKFITVVVMLATSWFLFKLMGTAMEGLKQYYNLLPK